MLQIQIQRENMSITTEQNYDETLDTSVSGTASPAIVSYAGNIKNTTFTRKPLSEIIEMMRSDAVLQKHIAEIHSQQDKTKRTALKEKNLPYFNMAMFVNDTRLDKNFERTQYFIFDVDDLGTDQAFQFKQQLIHQPDIFAAWISPSGDGVKFICRLENEISSETDYRALYEYYLNRFEDIYGIPFDHTLDPSRACFLSYDPDIYVNMAARPIPTDVMLSAKPRNKIKSSLDPLVGLLQQGTTAGNRTHQMTEIIGHCINRSYSRDLAMQMVTDWNQKNTPPHSDKKIFDTVQDMYGRYQEEVDDMPYELVVENGIYYKVTKNGDVMLSSFTVEPQELLIMEDSDILKADVTTSKGHVYKNIMLENVDWHSKAKLLKALGHQDCTFHGSDNDVQALCKYVNNKVTLRKTGTRVIGLLPEQQTWVTKGLNITAQKISYDPEIVSYDKGSGAFYHGIEYDVLSDAEYHVLVSGLYENITKINKPEIIIPWLSWLMATPVKPIVMDYLGGFPLTFVHGTQGGGKTSTAMMLKKLLGYKELQPHSCKEKSFPILKQLSATNAIPIFLDEYKAKLLSDDQMNNIIAYMNRAYSGETETKGQADQTSKDYKISAPMCVMGEYNISVPSIHERILVIRVTNAMKNDKVMHAAFSNLRQLPLSGFMPRYIQFCLQQDIKQMIEEAGKTVAEHFKTITIAPRIMNNLTVMVLGIDLFRKFGKAYNVTIPDFKLGEVLKNQLHEITGSNTGFVQTAVDQLINELSVMAMKEKKWDIAAGRDPNGFDCKIRAEYDYKIMEITHQSSSVPIKVLAINFKKILPDFRQYAKQTGYEGDLLDEVSYSKQFDETPYVVIKNHPVKFNDKSVRSLCIDIKKAKDAGIDLEGFGL
jgi:hypothetical protein